MVQENNVDIYESKAKSSKELGLPVTSECSGEVVWLQPSPGYVPRADSPRHKKLAASGIMRSSTNLSSAQVSSDLTDLIFKIHPETPLFSGKHPPKNPLVTKPYWGPFQSYHIYKNIIWKDSNSGR